MINIAYFKDDKVKNYGKLSWPFEEWVFGDSNILMGLHGRVSGTTIK